jgi:hydrogenase expression/formation protein HypE
VSATTLRREERIVLKQGAGGRAMRELIGRVLTAALPKAPPGVIGLEALDDGAAFPLGDQWLVVTTDSHVVKPIVFPGGDIGRLAVCGTVNDLAMMGATEVLGLTCAVVLEEGFPCADLARIQASLAAACVEARAPVVTGDTKVMGRGEVDGVILNTAGFALTRTLVRDNGLRPGDRIVVTGTVGDHGFAILAARQRLALEGELRSDVAPLNSLIAGVLAAAPGALTALKDPTRGGVASALHEMAGKSGVGIVIDEPCVPVSTGVRAASELVGIDPLAVANEGKALLGVRPEALDTVLCALRAHPLGRQAAAIGTCVTERPGSVILDTGLGRRLLMEPDGELLPRIC